MNNVLLKVNQPYAGAYLHFSMCVCVRERACICICTYLEDDGVLCELKGNTAANVIQTDVELYLSLALSFSLSQLNISHS